MCRYKTEYFLRAQYRVQFVVKLKAIKNTIRFSLLLFFLPPLLTSDLLIDQELIGSKEVTLSGSIELVYLVGSSLVSLKVVAFEKMNSIDRYYKNEVTLEIAWMGAICRII